MIIAIIDYLANIVIQTIDAMGYFGVFFLMAIESCGIPMPSEVIMPFSGFLVALGKMDFWAVSFLGAFGNLAGSLAAYWIGLRGGRPFVERYGRYFLVSKHDLDIADRWFKDYGELTAFFGRLLPVIRTYVSFPAGIARMDLRKFSFYTFLGALPWSMLFAWLGIKMGENWELIRQKLHDFDMLIAAAVVLVIAAFVIRKLTAGKRSGLTGD